jgi:nucleotide-binding universal stress UspA family protein
MIKKILVAIDRSDNTSQHVFQEALDLAKITGANLKILHVLSVDDKNSPNILALLDTPENKKRWQEFEKPGRELLQSLAESAIAAGVPTEIYQGLGRPGHVICETAKTWGADTIVIGRRGLSGISELLLGSVSNYVSHYAPCSVLLVQGSASSQPQPSNLRKSQMAKPI